MSLRLFVGVELHAVVRAQVSARLDAPALRALAPKNARFLAEDNWHLTLQFLGRVAESTLPALYFACARAAQASAPFAIELGAAGAFPSPRRARVVFIDIVRGNDALAQLATTLLAGTEPLGFPGEERAFRAHLTFARCKPEASVQPLLSALAPLPALAQRVDQLTLFRSHLSNQGARYEALEHWPLAAAPEPH
jgi:RNA 2',3'-cyclic 3'-phosphodiesterase